MNRYRRRSSVCLTLAFLVGSIIACDAEPSDVGEVDDEIATVTHLPTVTGEPTNTATPSPPTTDGEVDKWALWTGNTQLRGANIYQRRVYSELDGPDFMGPGPVGPPYTQADLNRLAALGANYVNVSHPGLFSENSPYVLDEDIQDNLDNLLDMIAQAGMFAVISFRTGPGRSEFTFFWGEEGDWFDASYFRDVEDVTPREDAH